VLSTSGKEVYWESILRLSWKERVSDDKVRRRTGQKKLEFGKYFVGNKVEMRIEHALRTEEKEI